LSRCWRVPTLTETLIVYLLIVRSETSLLVDALPRGHTRRTLHAKARAAELFLHLLQPVAKLLRRPAAISPLPLEGCGLGAADLRQLRLRLGKMDNCELLRFGQAARYRGISPQGHSAPPADDCLLQLREARAEWKRRKHTFVLDDSF